MLNSRSSNHDPDHGELHHVLFGACRDLEVLGEPSASPEQYESSLDDPALFEDAPPVFDTLGDVESGLDQN